MRNLKRALSLAVASVMLVGMMVVGTGASYNDVSSDYNQEAIEVLQAVGIMVGDEDGNFNPDAVVSRNEMAVVMSNLMDYRVATYAGTSPFTDVPTWAEPYVAACYTNGITGGIGNNLYGGSYSVTTVEATLMLMKALGYFQYAQDFGEDWQLAVVKKANTIELLDDVDSGVKEAMTRNDLAQLVLNTLKSGIVEADDSSIVKVDTGDVKVDIGGAVYNYVTSSKDYATAISSDQVVSSLYQTGRTIVELGEKLYQGDLKLDEDASEAFGRPAVQWTYKLDEVGTYADDALATYTAKASRATLYTLLGSSNVNKLSAAGNMVNGVMHDQLRVFVDGEEADGVAVVPSGLKKSDGTAKTISLTVADYFDRNDTGAAGGISGKGVLTEVYQDEYNNVTLVFVNTYLAQATADYSESKGDVNIDLLTRPNGVTINTLEDEDFDIAGVKEDDYILYTYSVDTGDIEAIAPAKVVTGEVNAYSVTNYVKIDGTQYDYAARIEGNKGDNDGVNVVTDSSADTSYVVTDTATIVLDAYGYVIYVDDASISVGNYVYIDGLSKKSGLSSTNIADAYFSDGRNEEIVVKTLTDNAGTEQALADVTNATRNTDYNGWYSFVKTSEGKYKLTEAKTSTYLPHNQNEIENGRVNIGNLGVSGNSDTIFLVNDGDDVTVYTGIANVPDVLQKVPASPVDIPVAYMQNKDNSAKAAILVYIDGENAKIKDSSKDSLLYLLDLDSTYVDKADNEPVYRFIAILDGAVATVGTKDSTWAVGKFFESYSIDSDGYYEGDPSDEYAKDSDKAVQALSGNATLSYSKGVLTINDTAWDINGNLAGVADGNNNVYVAVSDTKIVLVMVPGLGSDGRLSQDIMKDDSADYEYNTSISINSLVGLFKNYSIEGRIFIDYDDDATTFGGGAIKTELANTIYLEVTGATRLP